MGVSKSNSTNKPRILRAHGIIGRVINNLQKTYYDRICS